MDFATVLKSLVDTLGSTVLLPVFIFLFAVILGAKVGRAFRAAVTIGVAFIGINLVIGLMWGSLAEVSQAMVTNAGISREFHVVLELLRLQWQPRQLKRLVKRQELL